MTPAPGGRAAPPPREAPGAAPAQGNPPGNPLPAAGQSGAAPGTPAPQGAATAPGAASTPTATPQRGAAPPNGATAVQAAAQQHGAAQPQAAPPQHGAAPPQATPPPDGAASRHGGAAVHGTARPGRAGRGVLGAVLSGASGGAGLASDLRRALDRAGRLVCAPLASILLLRGVWLGLPLWLVVAQDLRRAGFAALGLGLGMAACRLLGFSPADPTGARLKANALLTALAVAWLVPAAAGPQALGLLVLGALSAAVLAVAIERALEGTDLPPLVFGYCAVAGTLFLIFPQWGGMAAAATDWGPAPQGIAGWAGAFLRSLGAFLFAPDEVSGAVIAATIAVASRAMFLAGAVGWVAGVLTALLLTGSGAVFYWLPAAYNFFIAGMALGAARLLPGWPGLAAAAMGGAFAALIAAGLQSFLYHSPAAFLPVAFGAAVWIGLGAARRAVSRGWLVPNHAPEHAPEDAWLADAVERRRWGARVPLLMVPLAAEVEVTQGFAGRLSHAGAWRHALDFQRPRTAAAGGRSGGQILGAPVLAPGPGVVERAETAVPDNPVGIANYADNWGNHVVIRLDAGGWCMLAHLAQGSVTVLPGMRVGFGTMLGRVGNSGRSPEPHLHLQVQDGPAPGAPTRAFRLANYRFAARTGGALDDWAAAAVPAEGTVIAAAAAHPATHRLMAGMAPGRGLWSVEVSGEVPRAFRPVPGSTSVRLDLALDAAGRQVMRGRRGGALTARFDLDAWRVEDVAMSADPLLRLIAIAAPVVPYAAVPGLGWRDLALGAGPGGGRWPRWLAGALAPYAARPFAEAVCRCIGMPDDGAALTVECRPEGGGAALPGRVTCEFRQVAGPARLVAEFPGGRLVCALYAFTPRMGAPLAIEV